MSAFFKFIDHQYVTLPPRPTADFHAKTIIVTGANSGLGYEACRWLISQNANKIIMACRNLKKGQAAKARLLRDEQCKRDPLEVWPLDLRSYDSVKEFAARASSNELPRLDGLILNAGVWARSFRRAEDNEESVTVNVISTFLLAFSLLPKLSRTADDGQVFSRICVVSSQLYRKANFGERVGASESLFANLRDQRSAVMQDRYKVTKLMQVVLAKHMADAVPVDSHHVIINTISPGWCDTRLGREAKAPWWLLWIISFILARSASVGARVLVNAIAAERTTHGQYLPDGKPTTPEGLATGTESSELRDRMWSELIAELETIQPGVTKLPLHLEQNKEEQAH